MIWIVCWISMVVGCVVGEVARDKENANERSSIVIKCDVDHNHNKHLKGK